VDRRSLLKLGCATGGSLLLGSNARAAEAVRSEAECACVLVDTTKCTGCRKCELACAEANGQPKPADIDDKTVIEGPHRGLVPTRWTVVNRYRIDGGHLDVKRQCMHCNHPACVTVCPVRALEKQPNGPVIWHEHRCIGCRYCMMACPFEIPTFEFDSPVPKIQKCILCNHRLQKGQIPACVEVCPVEALVFGSRKTLKEAALARIEANPDKYVHKIYGEEEAGGTGWLYMSSVPFDQIDFRSDLGTKAFEDYTRDIMKAVPVIMFIWAGVLYGVNFGKKQAAGEASGVGGGKEG
jgi:Fe-S-cluster-containing dehydrogenase component